jgi:RHS repeat-associated protein
MSPAAGSARLFLPPAATSPASGTKTARKLGADEVKTTYDRLGRKVTVTDQRGVVHTYAYDTAGRLASDAVTNTTLPSGVDGSVRRIEWTYDDLSRVSTVTSYDAAEGGDPVNQVAYTYDSWGNVASSRQAHDGAVGQNTPEVDYAYADGASGGEAKYVRLSSVTYPNGRVVYYNYPADGAGAALSRLDNIASCNTPCSSQKFVAYTYLGAGTIVKVEHPAVASGSGLTLSYGSAGTYSGWDRFGRVAQQVWKVGTTPVDSYGYAYDHNSNRTQRTNALNSNLSESYTYDGLDRLESTEREGEPYQDWGLDALGNWAGYVESDGETTTLDQTRTHDEANQIGEIDATIGEDWVDPAYDDAGNMVSGPKPGAETTEYKFVYDAWNRLVKVTDSAGTTTIAEYRYDGLGRRIAKLVPNGENWDRTDYHYNEAWQCLEQRYGQGQAKETVPDTPNVQWLWDIRYVDTPVLRWRSVSGTLDEVLYFCNDANMNVTALVNTSGTVVERYVYDPYGKATCLDLNWANGQATSRVGNEILYCGYRFDPETGLDHVRRRYYHPTLGRWVTRDMAGLRDGVNLYQYVRSSPILLSDPTGLWTRPSESWLQANGGLHPGRYWCAEKGDTLQSLAKTFSPSPEDWRCIWPAQGAVDVGYANGQVRPGDVYNIVNILGTDSVTPSLYLSFEEKFFTERLQNSLGKSITVERVTDGLGFYNAIKNASGEGATPISYALFSSHGFPTAPWLGITADESTDIRFDPRGYDPNMPAMTFERGKAHHGPQRCWFSPDATVSVLACSGENFGRQFASKFLRSGALLWAVPIGGIIHSKAGFISAPAWDYTDPDGEKTFYLSLEDLLKAPVWHMIIGSL